MLLNLRFQSKHDPIVIIEFRQSFYEIVRCADSGESLRKHKPFFIRVMSD